MKRKRCISERNNKIIDYKINQRTHLVGGNLLYGCKMYVEDISKPNYIYVMGEDKNEFEK